MDGGGFTVGLRALVAVLLLAGFYALGFALLAGLAWAGAWLLWAFPGRDVTDALIGVVWATAAGLAVPAWRVLRTRPDAPDTGVVVDDRAAPELWRHVRELAVVVGTRPPDEIRLVADANAYVWEDVRRLGLRGGERRLYVGVPLLSALTVEQMWAVLAHELGHYSQQHLRLGSITYRGLRAVSGTIEAIGPRTVLGVVLSGYGAVYVLVSMAVCRRQELEADAAAVRVAGPGVTAAALRRLPAVAATWQMAVASYARWARDEGYRPEELLARFARDPEFAGAPAAVAVPWDTHPPLAERLAAIGPVGAEAAVRPVGTGDERPAEVLVSDREAFAAALRGADFSAAIEAAAVHEAEIDAERLHTAAGRPGIDGLLRVLERIGPQELFERVRPAVRWDDGRADGTGLAQYLLAAVIAAGGARWRHEWGEPLRVEPPGMPGAVAAACRDRDAIEQLRALLGGEGVVPSPRRAMDHGRPFDGPLLPDELFALSYGPDRRRRPELPAFNAGLVAAVLAELRLLGRIEVSGGAVAVADPAPTGEGFLDAVLERVAAGPERAAHERLRELGSDVTDAVVSRARLRGTFRPVRDTTLTYATNSLRHDGIGQARAAARIRSAVEGGRPDERDLALAALVWAVEIAGPVLGRGAVTLRLRIERMSHRDPLARAVRTAVGMDTPA
ncbi:GPP34 family phosphoprotein [Dactylosporangium darangshiense]|uniref:GPP34 family phosphoprotein n=1 Tax=Dactylosporangium darangshiense TaxID=579108 RepID=UPI00363CF526